LGKRLKAVREEKGLTLESAGDQLNIKSQDLAALEREDFSSLLDRQFAWTILEIYATFLGFSKEEVKREFDDIWSEYGPLRTMLKKHRRKRTKVLLATETAEIPVEPKASLEVEETKSDKTDELSTGKDGSLESETFYGWRESLAKDNVSEENGIEGVPQSAASEEYVLQKQEGIAEFGIAEAATKAPPAKRRFPLAALIAIFAIAFGVFAFWQGQFPRDLDKTAGNPNTLETSGEAVHPTQEEKPEAEEPVNKEPEEPVSEESDTLVPLVEPENVTTQVVEEGTLTVEITTPNGECWIEVIADGRQVYYRLVPANTKPLVFKAEDEISVLIGDAAAARIKCNGEDLGVLGSRFVVVQRVFTAEE